MANAGPQRDFVPQDKLHEFDYLLDDRLGKLKVRSGKVMKIDADGTAYLFSADLEGCVIDDPATWVIAVPAIQMQSAIPPRFGQSVLWNYTDGEGNNAKYYGLDRFATKSPNAGLLKEVIHEGPAGQSIIFNAATMTYTIKDGPVSVSFGPSGITITAPSGTVTVPATAWTGNLTITGTLIVNGVDILTTLLATGAALAALNTLYLAHTHTVTTAPGVTGPPL